MATSPETFSKVKGIAEKMGKTFVEGRDFPGFIVNRILMPMINEAVYALYEGVAAPEAVDEALCFGWIDSKPNKRDAESFYQYFSKRNPKSNWSKVNKEKVKRLLAEGLITKSGLEAIEIAKQNGTWNALDEVEEIIIPDDLQKAFSKKKSALTNFEKFPRSSKRGILEWILNAKRPETRQKRIQETVDLAEKNIKANHY
jgi:uncharacterized protein YdeI (YjbR/CyaY-like superfamily)